MTIFPFEVKGESALVDKGRALYDNMEVKFIACIVAPSPKSLVNLLKERIQQEHVGKEFKLVIDEVQSVLEYPEEIISYEVEVR